MSKFVENAIISRVIDDALSAGYLVSVNDGEETVLKGSTSKADILAAMFTTGEDYLLLSHPTLPRKGSWIWLVYGNDSDVICDYTVDLESLLEPINDWIEREVA